eukprot:scaffold118142_cov63-Phaeocystis_antarctica.AAC.1
MHTATLCAPERSCGRLDPAVPSPGAPCAAPPLNLPVSTCACPPRPRARLPGRAARGGGGEAAPAAAVRIGRDLPADPAEDPAAVALRAGRGSARDHRCDQPRAQA